jgi:hypothetical protein
MQYALSRSVEIVILPVLERPYECNQRRQTNTKRDRYEIKIIFHHVTFKTDLNAKCMKWSATQSDSLCAIEAKRIGDDDDGRARHRHCGDQWRHATHHRNWNCDRVVGHSECQILPDHPPRIAGH